MTEADEIALALSSPRFKRMGECTDWVKEQLPGESVQVVDSVAWALWMRELKRRRSDG